MESKPGGSVQWSPDDWRMRPRVEDVETVLDNALDLLEESKRCKSVGALVLAELSLEQASLAAVLWGRTLLDRYGVTEMLASGRAPLVKPPSVPLAIPILLAEIAQFTDGSIKSISKSHADSLAHVPSVLRFMQHLAPVIFSSGGLNARWGGALPIRLRLRLHFRGKERFAADGMAELQGILRSAELLTVPTLDKTKNQLLYAQVNRTTGHVTLADLDEEQIESIWGLSGLIQEVVTNALNAADRLENLERKRQDRIRFLRRVERVLEVQVLPSNLEGEP